ncbi:MAG: hypothetical protein VX589_11700 [Myxococcota bacterium]|nr:hypothetical protein [Myxococcota bacterium]
MNLRTHRLNHRFSLAQVTIALGCFTAPLVAQAECRSAQPHISDAWCQAVQCAPVYVSGGFCMATDTSRDEVDDFESGLAVDEATPAAYEDDEQESPTDDSEDINDMDVSEAVDAQEAEPTGPSTSYGSIGDAECVSGQPNVSDAWCQAVGCHPTYIASGHCILVDEASSTDDDEASALDDTDVRSALDPSPTAPDASDIPSTGDTPTELDMDDAQDAAGFDETDTTVNDRSEMDSNEGIEASRHDGADTMVEGQCPGGWRRAAKDCANLPWQNSVRWHCSQELPPSTTQRCGDSNVDLTDEICVTQTGHLATEWCINPSPSKMLVCGGLQCDVTAANHECDMIPMGGGSFTPVCPN